MTNEKYDVIVADPAWAYSDHNTGGSFKSGSTQHYMTIKPESVSKMKVSSIMKYNAICFLWITVPLLPYGFDVLDGWGFTYKTMITWYKVDESSRIGRLGMGRYFRGMTEHCLIGIRGKIKPFGCQSQNVIIEKPRKHSQKPEKIWNLIDNAVINRYEGDPQCIELFCRGEPHISNRIMNANIKWDGWGNQCEGSRKVKLDLF